MTFIALWGALTKQNRNTLRKDWCKYLASASVMCTKRSCVCAEGMASDFCCLIFWSEGASWWFLLIRIKVEGKCVYFRTNTLLPLGRLFMKSLDSIFIMKIGWWWWWWWCEFRFMVRAQPLLAYMREGSLLKMNKLLHFAICLPNNIRSLKVWTVCCCSFFF